MIDTDALDIHVRASVGNDVWPTAAGAGVHLKLCAKQQWYGYSVK